MKIQLVMLGKTRRPEIRALIVDYLSRVERFAEVQVTELREDSAASLRKLVIEPAATVVLLDDAGKPQTSAQLRSGWAKRAIEAYERLFFCAAEQKVFRRCCAGAPRRSCRFLP